MADVSISYKGSTIAEMSASGTKTLLTEGKYCEDDVTVTYVAPTPTEVEEKDINFYDYDGTLVESWTLAELQTKTALPDNPSHEGLTAQGWNWTLAELQADNGMTDVGQLYITDDGNTRLYLCFSNGTTTLGRLIDLHFYQSISEGVIINWGDESTAETVSGTGYVSVQHTYANNGNYIITLVPDEGCYIQLGSNRQGYSVVHNYTSDTNNASLIKAELGGNFYNNVIGNSAFFRCFGLETISIPNQLSPLYNYCFYYCRSLKHITCSNLYITSGEQSINGCYAMKSLSLSQNNTSLAYETLYYSSYALKRLNIRRIRTFGNRAIQGSATLSFLDTSSAVGTLVYFTGFSCLEKVIIGSGVTACNNDFLRNSPMLNEVHFRSSTPPSIANSNAFSGCNSACKFYVPTGSLSAYTTATNYPDPDVYTYVEE